MGITFSIFDNALNNCFNLSQTLAAMSHTIDNDEDQDELKICIGGIPPEYRAESIRSYERGADVNTHLKEVSICTHGLNVREMTRLVTATNKYQNVNSISFRLHTEQNQGDVIKACFETLDALKYKEVMLHFVEVSRNHCNIRLLSGFFRRSMATKVSLGFLRQNDHPCPSSYRMARTILGILRESEQVREFNICGVWFGLIKEVQALLSENHSIDKFGFYSLREDNFPSIPELVSLANSFLGRPDFTLHLEGEAKQLGKMLDAIPGKSPVVNMRVNFLELHKDIVGAFRRFFERNERLQCLGLWADDPMYGSCSVGELLEALALAVPKLQEIHFGDGRHGTRSLSRGPEEAEASSLLKGTTALAEALTHSSAKVETMYLIATGLNNHCTEAFFSRLGRMLSLREIGYREQPITDEGLTSIANGVGDCPTLRGLSYSVQAVEGDDDQQRTIDKRRIHFYLARNAIAPLLTEDRAIDSFWPKMLESLDRMHDKDPDDMHLALKYYMLRERVDMLLPPSKKRMIASVSKQITTNTRSVRASTRASRRTKR